MSNNVVVNENKSTLEKFGATLGSIVIGFVLIALVLIIPAAVGGWMLMLLLGILNLNVAIGVPALSYATSVAIYYLAGAVLGLRASVKRAAEELKSKKS